MVLTICRICGTTKGLKSIFHGGESLLEKLHLCVNVQVRNEDRMPKHICGQCEQNLNISYRLREQAKSTEQRLRSAEEARSGSDGGGGAEDSAVEGAVEEEIAVDVEETSELSSKETSDYEATDDEELTFEVENEMYIEYLEETCGETAPSVQPASANDGIVIYEEIEEEKDEEDLPPAKETAAPVQPPTAAESLKNEDDFPPERDVASVANVPFVCATCLQVFQVYADYRRHIKTHGLLRFQCQDCSKWFPSRYRLQVHSAVHGSASPGDVIFFQCSDCDRLYRNEQSLMRHRRVAHEEQRLHMCKVCGESFGRADVFKAHMRRHNTEWRFTCDKCGQRFKTRRCFVTHTKSHQPKPAKEPNVSANGLVKTENGNHYVCPDCGKVSRHNFTHKNHLRTHTNERPFVCPMCGKAFRTAAALITHERTHTDERPYKCTICSSAFRQSSHLKEHEMRHNSRFPLACEYCEKSFIKKFNLWQHVKSKHPLAKLFEEIGDGFEAKTAEAPAKATEDAENSNCDDLIGK